MKPQATSINLYYVITDLKYGGAQTVLVYLLKYLDRGRFVPHVVCLFGGDLPLSEELDKMDIPVKDLKMTHPWRLDAFWRLYRLLKQEQITILHASLFHAVLLSRLVGRLARVPIIISWRQNVSLGSRWRGLVNRLTSRLDDRVVAVSKPARLAELLETKIYENKVLLIHNCIDIERFPYKDTTSGTKIRENLGIPYDIFVVGFVGRLHSQKGIDILLEAFSCIFSQRKDISLLIVGDGELLVQLRSKTEVLGISNRTKFTGIRKDIPDVLMAFDAFVLPSLWEGLPLALLEAMAAGLPVVATNVGGTPEVVVDGVTGFLVPPGDPEALANAIKRLIDDPELRKKFGQAGRERVEKHFTIQEMVRKMEALYLRLLAEKGIEV